MNLNKISEELCHEANETLCMIPMKHQKPSSQYPSPNESVFIGNGSNAACTILLDLVKKQEERMDQMEQTIEHGKEKITQLEQRIIDLQLGVNREAVDLYQANKLSGLTKPE